MSKLQHRLLFLRKLLKKRKVHLVFLPLFLLLIVLPIIILTTQQKQNNIQHASAASNTYYVSRNGSNADGLSWATAWNELNKINWSIIQPGDTIIIDGGATACPSNYDFSNHATNRPGLNCGMLYVTQLNIQKSGTATSGITIKLSPDTGHNGTAVVFGGRSSMLPYCTQNYTATGTARADGIVFNTRSAGASYITIDGTHRSGIMVYGAGDGVNLISDNSTYDTIRNLEIFDNGIYMTFSGGGYHSDYPGIFLDGSNITIDRTLIHDNGQDEIQDNYTGYGTITHAPMHDMVVTESWLYNHRESPVWPGYPFNSGAEGGSNDCTHVDGIQIYGGGPHQQRFTVKDSIFGPLLAQGFYPGDEGNTTFDYVTVTNTLFINALLHNIEADDYTSTSDTSTPLNWTISNITSYLTNGVNTGEQPHGFGVWGGGHSMMNSILYQGGGWFQRAASFTGPTSENIAYNSGDPIPGSMTADPQFVGPLPTNSSPGYAILANADFTPQCNICAGKGANIHKVQDLLNMIDTLNASGNPTGNATPTLAPSPTATQLTPTPTAAIFPSATPTLFYAPTMTPLPPTPTFTPVPLPTYTPVPTTSSNSINFQAESGSITYPFKIRYGTPTYIYQSSETGVTNGGRAAYTVNINSTGNYVVNTVVNAADTGSNSFYVNFDSEPSDPMMIWDIYPVTSGFRTRTVGWRGNGTPDSDQYYPKVFYLTQGVHTLIIRGREANTKLDSITITPY